MSEKGPLGIFPRPFRKLLGQELRLGRESGFPHLFDLQDSLIEHKFPTSNRAEWIISNAGDIYRMMTEAYPDYYYIEEKWSNLTKYASAWGSLTFTKDDFERVKEYAAKPDYMAKRNQYLSNLEKIRIETLRTSMDDSKRKDVMLAALDMINGLIRWFESLNPEMMPKQEMARLTDTVARYFPEKFWEERNK